MKNLSVFFIAVVFIISQTCLSDTTIDPSTPTTSDIIEITAQGQWGNACVPTEAEVDVFGDEIYFIVDTYLPSGIVCADIVVPWQLTNYVGPLATGTYTIYTVSSENLSVQLLPPFTFQVSNKRFQVSPLSLSIDEGSTGSFTVRLVNNPNGPVTASIARQSGDTDISIQSGATLSFNSSNYMTPQPVTLFAAEDSDAVNGSTAFCVTATGYITSVVSATEADNDIPATLYVDKNATGTENGTQWQDAFTDLQDALSYAASYPQVQEIRVAHGVYTPGLPGDRGALFVLVDGTSLKGGYAGVTKPSPDARNVNVYETILSGDLNGDDGPDFANYSDNSFNVINGDGTPVLDGFTITAGNSTGGAGMIIYGYDPTILNCTFKNNWASYGAAIRGYNASPVITNCLFINNSATQDSGDDGGALFLNGDQDPRPVLTNCTIVANAATDSCGGIYTNLSCVTTLNNCILWMNTDGGGIDESSQLQGTFTINNCCIQGWTGARPATASFGTDPDFVSGPLGDYYLSQISAGQPADSPCLDAGNDLAANLGLDQVTTQTKNLLDTGPVDLGYHYQPTFIADINRDGRVNFADFAILAAQWQQTPSGPFSADIAPDQGDGIVDLQDLTTLAEY